MKKLLAILLISYLAAQLVMVFLLSHWRIVERVAPPDFSAIEQAAERKQAFFNYLRPIVEKHNQLIAHRRQQLQRVLQRWEKKGVLSGREQTQLDALAQQYNIRVERSSEDKFRLLQRRVDTIPVALVLVQAAKESAWGRSRFAREGNNYFGQWCFTVGCGLIPAQRSAGDKHEVRRFDSAQASVASYMHNLNTHRAYRGMRAQRAHLRAEGVEPSGYQLAQGLGKYSERGAAYVNEIRKLILANKLESAPPASLPPVK